MLNWMLKRMKGQKELTFVIEDTLAKAQQIMDERLRLQRELNDMSREDSLAQ